jgi:hypothetical protein
MTLDKYLLTPQASYYLLLFYFYLQQIKDQKLVGALSLVHVACRYPHTLLL